MKKKYGFAIVNSGDQAIVYNLEGEARIVEGPQRLFLWREKIEYLTRYTASQTEYLIVKHRKGKVEHIKGPCSMFRVPIIHDKISVQKAITLDAHEVVIVYRHNGDASERTVDRYLEYGPKMFVPASNEWLHKFCWHGVDPNNKTRYIPATNKFTKLKLVPEQFYYNVDEIRTSDNGLIRVKLMVFYEITDVDEMLSSTDDPVGDIISCLCADVTTFTATKSYTEFVEKSSNLNELSNYPQLTAMCKGSGFRVTKVVFRGYFAAPKIQANHDEAIEKRTNLQLQYEREQQTQEMMDRELLSERERLSITHKLEREELIQSQKIEDKKETHRLWLQAKEIEEQTARQKEDGTAAIEKKELDNKEMLEHYSKLKALGVDLNGYILNQAAIPEKVTKIKKGDGIPPNIHMYIGRQTTL